MPSEWKGDFKWKLPQFLFMSLQNYSLSLPHTLISYLLPWLQLSEFQALENSACRMAQL